MQFTIIWQTKKKVDNLKENGGQESFDEKEEGIHNIYKNYNKTNPTNSENNILTPFATGNQEISLMVWVLTGIIIISGVTIIVS